MLKSFFESALVACRWMLAPFFLALVAALVGLIVKVALRAYDMATKLLTASEEDVILGTLGLVDLTLSACLIVLVIFSVYSNFVSRIEPKQAWPGWMGNIDYGELKLKLLASIVAISSIKLLEGFMNVGHESDRILGWEMGIFGAFVLAALLLGIAEAVGHAYGDPPHGKEH